MFYYPLGNIILISYHHFYADCPLYSLLTSLCLLLHHAVPELTKPLSTQSPAAPSSASPSPGPIPSASSSPATAAAGGAPPQGGNNAKRPAVANGQPPTAGTQAPQRYMPREVPPRFRCQQDHKVLLKRGQPPLSSMLLGGGGGGGDDSSPGYVGPAAPSLPLTSSSSSSSIAASSTSSNYANSTWGTGSGSLPSSQGREKVIVDGSDLEEWPNIAPGDGSGGGGASGPGSGSESSVEGGGGMPNSCASWKGGDPGSPSPTSSFSMSNECMLSGSVVWGSAASQGPVEGNAAPGTSLPPIPKSSPLPVGPDGSLGGSGGIPGANFNPNANPSAWPALVQQDGAGAASSEGAPPSSFLQSQVGSLSANNPPPALGNPPLALNQSAHQHQLHQMQSREREHPSDGGWGGAALETGAGPKNAGTGEGANIDCGGGGNGGDNLSASQTSSSWGGQPFPAANSKTGASRTDGWEGGAAEGGGGSRWGYSAQGVMEGKPGASSSGGSIGNPPAAASSPKSSTTTTRALDNQKGVGVGDGGTEGDTGEWGGGRGGRGHSSSRGGGNHNQHHGYGHHRYSHPPPPNPEVALQAMLSRNDLDPRVLSNTGWGQTQIRQNVAWDLEPGKGGSGLSASSKNSPPPIGPSSQYSTGSATTTDSPSLLPGWGNEGSEWGGGRERSSRGGWGDNGQQGNQGGGGGGGGWGGSQEEKGTGGGWKEMGRDGGGCGGQRERGGGTGESERPNRQHQSQPQQQPLPQQALDPGDMQGGEGWGRPSGPQAQNQSSSGWTAGPIPSGPNGGEGPQSSGWEEPSPQFISRKMDIDDGTSAWGDPSQFNNKTVNLWEKNGVPTGQQLPMHGQGPGPPPQQQQPGPPHIIGVIMLLIVISIAGSKSMQEGGWGEGDQGSVAASRHPSWEEEEEGGAGVWNSVGSQGSSSSYNSGGWGQGHGGKKPNNKVGQHPQWVRLGYVLCLQGDDPSGRPLDLAPGPPQDKKMEGEKRGMVLNDYNGEMRKGGQRAMGGGGMVYRSPGSKEMGPGDPGPYYDKVGTSDHCNALWMGLKWHPILFIVHYF
uniref:Argonaute hook domain-containing protein n=1 Tax=Oncorhynchus tshawytscha TaxID=74940 RepID=A0AAZ3P1K5_ONCTS